MIYKKTSYDRIIERLAELGMKPTTASKNAGLDASFIRQMSKNPERKPHIDSATKLSKVLGKSPQWILSGAEEETDIDLKTRFQIDSNVLDIAMLRTDQILVGAKIKVSREDRCKMIAYHYESEQRKRHNLPTLEQANMDDLED